MAPTFPDPIGAFDSFTVSPPVLPKFYWDVESQEQRIKRICESLNKLAQYLNKISAALSEYMELLEEIKQKIDGFDQQIADLQQQISDLQDLLDWLWAYLRWMFNEEWQVIFGRIHKTANSLYVRVDYGRIADEPGPWNTFEDSENDPNWPKFTQPRPERPSHDS